MRGPFQQRAQGAVIGSVDRGLRRPGARSRVYPLPYILAGIQLTDPGEQREGSQQLGPLQHCQWEILAGGSTDFRRIFEAKAKN